MFKKLYIAIVKGHAMRFWKKQITRNFKDLKQHRKLTRAQKKEVDDFYVSMIGRKVPLYCHEYFYSRTGVFAKEYVPNNFYHCELIPRANESSMMALCDKNLCESFFPNERIVRTLLKNINGYYYSDGKPISEAEAIAKFWNMDDVIIKPSRESKGHGVNLLNVKDGVTNISGKTLSQVFKDYKRDFLIQELVRQHKDMAALNPSSVNTIRVLSYRSGMEILIIYSVVRIGRKDKVIDNQCSGGISTTVSEDGLLGEKAFGGYYEDNILKTDSGIILKDYRVPSYDKVIDMVKRLHMRLPFFDLVGWDMAVQEDGQPILIEFNTNPGLSQSAFKSGMGEYTERVIRELWKRPNTRY